MTFRANTLRNQLVAFHRLIGQPIGDVPHVPDEKTVRFRASLIAEEMREILEAMFDAPGGFVNLRYEIDRIVRQARVRVNLPDLADALGDTDYVIEGTRVTLGIDGGPIADEIHRTNMLKGNGPTSPEGKRLKPPGWQPPDIAGELRKQGWKDG